jgi:hypothetical protein
MAFSFTNLFKKESGKSTQPLTITPVSAGNRSGAGDDESEHNEDRFSANSETTTEMTNHMAANPFEQIPGVGAPAQTPQSPFAIDNSNSPFTQMPPIQQQPPAAAAPIQQAAFEQSPFQTNAQNLESKGFRPLSSLPGGQVPNAAPGLAGLEPLGQKPANGFSAPLASVQGPNGTGGGSPFEMPQQGAAPLPQMPSAASPFEVQLPPASPFPQAPLNASPFEPVLSAPAPAPAPAPAQSFEIPAPAPQAASPFAAPASAPSLFPDEPILPATTPAFEPAPVAETSEIELSLKEVLLSVQPDKLGFDALKVPDDVTASFPMSLIKPQLSTGRVVLKLKDVVEACQERFHPAFAKADLETSVNLPMESIFHQLPTEPAPAPAASPFGFAPAPAAPAKNPIEIGAPPTFIPQPQAASPFAMPQMDAPTAAPENHSPFLSEADDLAPAPANPFAPVEPESVQAMSMPLPAPAASSWGGMEPLAAPNQQASEPQQAPATQWSVPLPAPAPEPVAPSAPAASDDQLQLRALLMTSGHLDAQRIISLCDEMPGVDACCLLSENGSLQASSINSREFADKAQRMVAGLVSVSEGLGVADSNDFSLQTPKGNITFFKATPIYLGVQHSEPSFQPGVREKLTLISRELSLMS